MQKLSHRSTRLCVGTHVFTKFSEITQYNGHYAVRGHSRSPTEGFPWDDLRKILPGCRQFTNVLNGAETLPKISIGWVGCTNVTDRRQKERQTDGRRHTANMNMSSRSLKTTLLTAGLFRKFSSWTLLAPRTCYIGLNSRGTVIAWSPPPPPQTAHSTAHNRTRFRAYPDYSNTREVYAVFTLRAVPAETEHVFKCVHCALYPAGT